MTPPDYPKPIAPLVMGHDERLGEMLEEVGAVGALFRFGVFKSKPGAQSERLLARLTPTQETAAHAELSADDRHALAVAMRDLADALEPETAPMSPQAFYAEVCSIVRRDDRDSILIRSTAEDHGPLRLYVLVNDGRVDERYYNAAGATVPMLLEALRTLLAIEAEQAEETPTERTA